MTTSKKSPNSGISVYNSSAVPLLVIASQVTPLHWGKVMPGETWNAANELKMGKVWFTVSVSEYEEKNVPSRASVAVQVAAVSTIALLDPCLLFPIAATVMGHKAAKGVSKAGVYADGKTLVVVGGQGSDGARQLRFIEPGVSFGDVSALPLTPVPEAPHMTGEAYEAHTGEWYAQPGKGQVDMQPIIQDWHATPVPVYHRAQLVPASGEGAGEDRAHAYRVHVHYNMGPTVGYSRVAQLETTV